MINHSEEVLNIFKEYFGEEFVDRQERENDGYDHDASFNVIIYYPSVIVSNEKGQSEVILDLFVKVPVKESGHLVSKFYLKRSTYTARQAQSGYTHSHISTGTSLGTWGNPCLGTGPINGTIDTLKRTEDSFEDLIPFWELLCREIDDYVHVESLAGGPYIRMEDIGTRGHWRTRGRTFISEYRREGTYTTNIPEIAKQLLESGKLKWSYLDGSIRLAMSDVDFALIATREAFNLYKNTGRTYNDFSRLGLTSCKLTHGELIQAGDQSNIRNVGGVVMRFKDRDFHLRVIDGNDTNNHIIVILSDNVLCKLKDCILYLINATYGKSEIAEDAVFL